MPTPQNRMRLLNTAGPKLPTSGLVWASTFQQGSDSQIIYDLYNNNGYRGSTTSSDVNDPPWLSGGGLGSDGVDDYSTLPASILSSDTLTIVSLVSMAATSTLNHRYLGAKFGSMAMGINRTSASGQINFTLNNGSTTTNMTNAGIVIALSENTLVAHTVQRSTGAVSISKNGSAFLSLGTGNALPNAPTELYVGASELKNNVWPGQIHFFAVYNYRSSDTDIQQVYRYAQWLMRQRGVTLP